MRVLVMTAVAAESDAVLRGLRGDSRFDVLLAGVGPIAAAAHTAAILATTKYDLVVSMGIAGGFIGQAAIGTIVVATECVAAELGAETPDGFLSLEELGFGFSRIGVDAALAEQVTEAFRSAGLAVSMGPILTVSTATGTASTALALAERVPGAVAEAMEGFGIANAAHNHGIPVLEIRTISNSIGPRDREAWRIKDALDALETASSTLSSSTLSSSTQSSFE